MPRDEIASAHQRMVEQVMSDERLLGVLPDDLSGLLLDWTVRQIDAASAAATDLPGFQERAERIRVQARTIADTAAEAEDDAAALATRLERAESEQVAGASPRPDDGAAAGSRTLEGATAVRSPAPRDDLSLPVHAPVVPLDRSTAATTPVRPQIARRTVPGGSPRSFLHRALRRFRRLLDSEAHQ